MTSARTRILAVIALGLVWLLTPPAARGLDAFEGALGQGALASGGRGGDVYHVTNLSDYGKGEAAIPGSLRHGIESATGPRTIIFDAGGALELARPLSIRKSNLTLAGQTAPGGVTVWAYPTSVSACSNVIIRYLRFRTGDFNAQTANPDGTPTDPVGGNGNMDLLGDGADAISVGADTDRIIFDHLSASWSMDETMSISGNHIRNITFQHCIIAESLNDSFHYKGEHGYGSLIRGDLTDAEQAAGSGGFTLYGNLWIDHKARNAGFGGQQTLEAGQLEADRRKLDVNFVNNVVFNWGSQPSHRVADGQARIDYVNNYVIAGPNTPSANAKRVFVESLTETTLVYQAGNVVDWDQDNQDDGASIDDAAGDGATEAFTIDPAADMLVVAILGESSSVANGVAPAVYWNDSELMTLRARTNAASNVVLIYTLENPTPATAAVRWESSQSDGVLYLAAQTFQNAAGREIRVASDATATAPFQMLLDYGNLGAGSYIFEAVVGNNNNSLHDPGSLLSGQSAVAMDLNNLGSWSALVANEPLAADSADEQNATWFDDTAGDPDRVCNAGIAFVVPESASATVSVVNVTLPDGVTSTNNYSLHDIPPGHPELVPVSAAFVAFDPAELVDQPHNFFSWIQDAVRPAAEAYQDVIASAGASLNRDAIDQRLIGDLTNRTGAIINSQEIYRTGGILPGIDDLLTATRPAGYDTDQDGISDEFEIAHGLDPNDPADRNGTGLSPEGWSNLERFLDHLAGAQVPTPFESWVAAAGLTGADAAFEADPNHDGIANGQAFVFGATSPQADATALRPTATMQGGAFVFEFRRRAASGVLTSVEYGPSLNTWSPAQDGADGVSIAVSKDFFGPQIDKVTVSLATATRPNSTFVRLRAWLP